MKAKYNPHPCIFLKSTLPCEDLRIPVNGHLVNLNPAMGHLNVGSPSTPYQQFPNPNPNASPKSLTLTLTLTLTLNLAKTRWNPCGVLTEDMRL